MPTTLTTPIVRSITHATVDEWKLSLVRGANMLPNADTQFCAKVSFRTSDGNLIYQRDVAIKFSAMSAGAQTVLRAFHAEIVPYLRTLGLMPAGTDASDV